MVAILDMEYLSCYYALDYYSVQGKKKVLSDSVQTRFRSCIEKCHGDIAVSGRIYATIHLFVHKLLVSKPVMQSQLQEGK